MSRSRVTVEEDRYEQEPPEGGAAAAGAPGADLVATVRRGVLGDGTFFEGPFGPRPIVYADHTASGRALGFIETYIAENVLPLYGNTHTTTSITGRQSTLFRTEARDIVRRSVNAGARDVVLFVGNGVTGGINRLVHTLGLRRPGSLHGAAPERLQRWRRTHSVEGYSYHNLPVKPDPLDVAARSSGAAPGEAAAAEAAAAAAEAVEVVVFVGPFEHHSNILPWRESLARVVQIGEDSQGGIDAAALESHLQRESSRPNTLLIGSFSAGSNVTGVLADTRAITVLLHKYGALSFWDFAAAGPHVKIDLNPSGTGASDSLDGAFISPHKFVGGPQCPGVLVLKRHIFDLSEPPEQAGGGTVLFVTEDHHRYLDDLEEREEAGTPAIVGAIRCGMVFQLHAAVGHERMQALEQGWTASALGAWASHPLIEVLGPKTLGADRLPIVSFMIRHQAGGRYLHYNFVCSLLNDLFGIQSRGGCACAGPYGLSILGIDHDTSRQFEEQLVDAQEIIRPGFVRVSFPYFFSREMVDYVVSAVRLVADHGWRMLGQYRFYHETGEWKHHTDLKFKQRQWLQSISYATGELSIKRARNGTELPRQTRLTLMTPEQQSSALKDLLTAAEGVLSGADSAVAPARDEGRAMDAQSEALRWFVFPSDSTKGAHAEVAATPQMSLRPQEYKPGVAAEPPSSARADDGDGGEARPGVKRPRLAEPAAADGDKSSAGAQPAAKKKPPRQNGGQQHGAAPSAQAAAKKRKKVVEKKLLKLTGTAIKDYGMITDGDRILVGLSGGKDSLTMLQMLLALQRKAPIKFDIGVCTVDPMTEAFDPSPLKKYVAQTLKLPYFFESQPIIDSAEKHMQRDSICAFCSRMKRGILYSCARREGYNVLALGQHLDDLAESFVMSAFNNGRLRTMKAHYRIEAGDVRVIRPFAYVREHMTREYAQLTTMPVIPDNCPGCFNAPTERAHIKQLLASEEERTPAVFSNLLKTIRPLMENDVDMEHTADAVAKRLRQTVDKANKARRKQPVPDGAEPSAEPAPARPRAQGYCPSTGGFKAPQELVRSPEEDIAAPGTAPATQPAAPAGAAR